MKNENGIDTDAAAGAAAFAFSGFTAAEAASPAAASVSFSHFHFLIFFLSQLKFSLKLKKIQWKNKQFFVFLITLKKIDKAVFHQEFVLNLVTPHHRFLTTNHSSFSKIRLQHF